MTKEGHTASYKSIKYSVKSGTAVLGSVTQYLTDTIASTETTMLTPESIYEI